MPTILTISKFSYVTIPRLSSYELIITIPDVAKDSSSFFSGDCCCYCTLPSSSCSSLLFWLFFWFLLSFDLIRNRNLSRSLRTLMQKIVYDRVAAWFIILSLLSDSNVLQQDSIYYVALEPFRKTISPFTSVSANSCQKLMMLCRQPLRFFLNFADDSSIDSSPEKSISKDGGKN